MGLFSVKFEQEERTYIEGVRKKVFVVKGLRKFVCVTAENLAKIYLLKSSRMKLLTNISKSYKAVRVGKKQN